MDLLPTGNIMSYDSTYKLVANSQHIWCFILTFSTHIALQDFPKFTDVPDLEIERKHQNPILGFTTPGPSLDD